MTPSVPPGAPGVGFVAVGRITRAHGIHGEVAVLPLSEVGSRFEPGSRLFAGEREDRPLHVTGSRGHGNRLLVAFAEVPDRTGAEALAGTYLFVRSDEVPELPEGEYWPHQIVGCEVLTESGRPLGTLRQIMHTPANDIWAARGEPGTPQARETLVPALRDVVVSVDLAARRIVVREIPGLTIPDGEPE